MFRKQILAIFTAVMLLGVGQAQAVDITFTISGVIDENDVYDNVYVRNDGTVVDMLGGDVDGIATYDASMVNIYDGNVNTLGALEFSTANVSGGDVYTLWAWDSATVNLSDTGSVSSLSARDDHGVANMYGGIADYVCPVESGIVNLYGGLITDSLSAIDSSVVNIYGYDLVMTSSGGGYNCGQVCGFWEDDTAFTIDLNGSGTYSHINLIPEPSTVLLMALGTLVLRKRKNDKTTL